MKLPLVPLSEKRAKKISKHYLGWGQRLSKIFPSLDINLERAGFSMEAREWSSVAFYSFLNYFSIIFVIIFSIAIMSNMIFSTALLTSMLVGFAVGFGTFFYINMYPRIIVSRKIRDVEKNLPQALHHLLIEVRSGMPLFNSFISLARSNYGSLSKEFQNVVNEINTGKSEIEALEKMTRENYSLYFRRIMWQLVNAMKSGADIGSTLKEIVEQMTLEQKADIKKYGVQLNSMALFYMIFVIIFPTLGIVFLLILSSFMGAFFDIQVIMLGVLGFLVLIQFLFIGMIKGKRPVGV